MENVAASGKQSGQERLPLEAPLVAEGEQADKDQRDAQMAAATAGTNVLPLRTDEKNVPSITAGPAPQEPLPLNLSPREFVAIRRTARLLLILGVAYGVMALLWTSFTALIPFIVGLVLAYVLLPLVNWLNQRMPRWAAILTVYGLTTVIISAVIAYIVPPLARQIGEIAGNVPDVDSLQGQANGILNQIRRFLPEGLRAPFDQALSRSIATIQTNISSYASRVGSLALSAVLQVLDTLIFLFGFLVIPFWLFYILNDYKGGLSAVDRLIPAYVRDDFWALMRIIDNVFSKYIRGQLFLGLIVGTSAGVGLFALQLFGFQVPYILVLALFAGTTELIPIIGPIIGAVPAIVLASFDGPGTALAVTILYIVIQQIENQVLVPRIVGESVGIHPAVMFVLLAVASQAFGLIGAILAAPAAAALRDIVMYLNQRLSDPVTELAEHR